MNGQNAIKAFYSVAILFTGQRASTAKCIIISSISHEVPRFHISLLVSYKYVPIIFFSKDQYVAIVVKYDAYNVVDVLH